MVIGTRVLLSPNFGNQLGRFMLAVVYDKLHHEYLRDQEVHMRDVNLTMACIGHALL